MPDYADVRDRIIKLIENDDPDLHNWPGQTQHIHVDTVDKVINIIVPTGCQSISINLKLTTK